MIPKESPLRYAFSPWHQAAVAAIAIPGFILLFWGPSKLGVYDLQQYFPWTVAAALTFLFGITNTILSLSATDQQLYWRDSIFAYASVLVFGALMAWLFSGLSIYEAMSFKWIYIVFTFAYLIFMSMVQAMRKIVKIAQDQDARLRGERDEK